MPTHGTQSASQPPNKKNQACTTYKWNSVSLSSTQQGNIKHVLSVNVQTRRTHSASYQPSNKSDKHIQATNVQTHGTQSTSDQPGKENVKHVFSVNMQAHRTWGSGPLLCMACTSPISFNWFLCTITEKLVFTQSLASLWIH